MNESGGRRLSLSSRTFTMGLVFPCLKRTMDDSANRIPADASAPVETLYEGHWLSLRKRGRWEYAERNNPGGAVIILAVTPEDKVLFVEQYRVSILQNTIEMPAGQRDRKSVV